MIVAYVAVLDANVLYGNEVRDLLIRVARSGLVRAHWTGTILDEVTRNLALKRDIPAEKLATLRERMNAAIPGVLVQGYEDLIDGLKPPDPDDRHVLAAAIASGSDIVVTWNFRDFPGDLLAAHGLEAKTPDDLVLDLIDIDEGIVRDCVRQIANARSQVHAVDRSVGAEGLHDPLHRHGRGRRRCRHAHTLCLPGFTGHSPRLQHQ